MLSNNRYLYLNQAGQTKGPYWLAEIRRHFRDGRLGPDSPVCHEGTTDWDPARMYPEITEDEVQLPVSAQKGRALGKKASFSWGMWIIILLIALFMAWVHFFVLDRFFTDH